MNLQKVLNNDASSKEKKLEAIGEVRDVLDYGEKSDEEILLVINELSKEVVKQRDDDIKEAMLNAILEGSKSPVVEKNLYLEPIVKNLKNFNTQCLSYILSMLGNSGNESYRQIIESYSDNPKLIEDVKEALSELDYRNKNS